VERKVIGEERRVTLSPIAFRPTFFALASALKISLAILSRIAYYYWQATQVTKGTRKGSFCNERTAMIVNFKNCADPFSKKRPGVRELRRFFIVPL